MSTATDLKFLIVDDFSTMRRIVRGLLKEMGCNNAEEAEDGAVALNMLKAQKFDFVVSDINMPNMNGFDLLKAIKADDSAEAPAGADGHRRSAQGRHRAAPRRSGAAGYIVKPFTKATLKRRCRRSCRSWPPRPERQRTTDTHENGRLRSAGAADGRPGARPKSSSSSATSRACCTTRCSSWA